MIYSCEGNIGAGKSTLLAKEKMRMEDKHYIFLQEPVDEWTKVCDENGNILENFYKDPKKYAFAFQILAFTTRLSILKKTMKENPDAIIICERSLQADGNIFAKMLYDDGLIDEISYRIYMKMYEEAVLEFPLAGIIYLSASPEVCNERIRKRNRLGEENISLDYLKKCHRYHEEWLKNENIVSMDSFDF